MLKLQKYLEINEINDNYSEIIIELTYIYNSTIN